MMRLIFNSGPMAGTEIATAAALLKIGSDPHNDIVLEDNQVAGRHCLLQRSPRGLYVLEDLGSQQGTLVNGKVVQNMGRPTAIYLSHGDRFQIGSTEVEIGEGRARLMVTGGSRAGFELPLDEHPVTIGRAPDNVLDFADPDVSVYHAAVLSLPTGFTIQDNGSTNGTQINGHRIDRHTLADGDVITVGGNELYFLVDIPDASQSASDTGGPDDLAVPPAPIQLVFVAGPNQGISLPLSDSQITFGRRQDATVTLDDMQVSGLHCGVTQVAGPGGPEVHVTDLGSTNGTFLNGEKLTGGRRVMPGDLIEIGQSVLELRVSGGYSTEAGMTTAMTTVIADGAYELASQPKFIIAGHVESAHEITIGRSPACVLRLEGRGVSANHAVIKWEDGFHLEDRSSYGTYLNDRRIVRERLATGHVIRVGEHVIEVQIRGERCTLDVIDRATAMAAIEIAREKAFDLAQAVPDPQNTGAAAGGAAYKTVFKLELPDTEALIQERKAKFKEGAPAWRPSTDITPSHVGKIAVLSSLVAAGIIGALVLIGPAQADALINHPLSESHASKAFAVQAEELGIESGCTACHSPGNGVPQAKCVACHEGFETVRDLHVASSTKAPHQSLPGSACTGCHFEHRGLPRKNEQGSPTLLGAGATCADASCHPNQHSAEFLREGPPPPLVLEAGPVPSFDTAGQPEFHVAHAVVETGGKSVAVGCTSCHAREEGGKLVETIAGKSCFGCHTGGEQHVNSQCAACHRDEHGSADLEQLPDDHELMAQVAGRPATGRSLLVGGALAMAVFLPLAGIALILRIRRRQRSMAVVEHIHQFPVQTIKRLVHSINVDKCVGCQMCVQACPASVLELVNHKSVVVNFDACIQCKKCEDVCAFDALVMHDADKPPPMIKMPDVDNYYETRVKGMYLIGQAAGTPQVKNAVNLGRAAIQHMTRAGGLYPGAGHQMGAACDVVIVGSGPAGLSAAVTASRLGLSYILLEKQRNYSWTVRSYYHKGKPVMAEPHDVEMVGYLPHWDTVREELLAAWDQAVAQYDLQIQYNQDVTDIRKDGELFTVTVSDPKGNPIGSYSAPRVVIAIGTMGNPRKLGCPGDDLEKVANALVDPDEFHGKDILVVGGTDSAIEVVLALCETNRVWLSVRSAKFDRVKSKNLERIEMAIAEGKCIPMFATVMKEVTPTTATLEYKADKRQEQIPNDQVFAMIGGHPPTKFLESVGVPYVEKPHSWSPPRTDELAKETGL
jgi:pSer/pThr/pTyr-binding forkhead associated (FHA) protein/thioredoxin reductase/NAD-dependent dihydropyrimidine dehydrogenase PreA subunit